MTLIAVIVAVSLAGSFFCSLSEAALYSVPVGRIETLRRMDAPGGRRLWSLRQRVEEPIAAILALNTAFNGMGGVWAGALVQKEFGIEAMLPFSIGFTLAVLFLSEIMPKSLGVKYAERVAPRIALPLDIVIWALLPYIRLAGWVTALFGKKARLAHPTEQDLISSALLSEEGGKILPQEARLIRHALRLNEILTADLMTPASKMRRIPDMLPLSMTKVDAGHWRYKRIPVCRDDAPDRIVGWVHRRDVFTAMLHKPPETTMRDLMRTIHFVRDNKPAHMLLNFFLQRRTQIACVKDASGRIVGVVTLEDVLEDMIGAEIE